MSNRIILIGFVIVLAVTMTACGGDDKENEKESFTIGVLNHAGSLQLAFEGFKVGMTEAGYIEGENVTYLYDGPTGSVDALGPVAEDLKTKDVDLVLSLGTPPTSLAQQTFDTSVPIIFVPVNDPVAAGFVTEMSAPGGNITGIRNSISTARALEWLVVDINPDVKRVLVPHNPNDNSSVASLAALEEAAGQLSVELAVVEVTSAGEVEALAAALPDDVDAVFIVRSGLINSRAALFVEGANALKIPVATSLVGLMIEDGVMVGYGADYTAMGTQAARLADQVLGKGANPAELPVETAESFLGLNLITAATIDIEMPDSVLRQAEQIVREGDE